jgi:small-conductance mechanosensitive channel/CRP-like cAMP-binding protein
MNQIPSIVMNIAGAVILYTALTLIQRLLIKRVKVLRYSPVALNILFLLFSVNLFLWDELSVMHPDAANWNITALLFMVAYLAIRLIDYWVFDLVVKRRSKAPIPVVLRDIFRWVLSTAALFVIVRTIFPGINLNVLAVSSIVIGYVLGNATQDTLGNLVSGLALNTESPFMIGDWVEIAGHTGRIVDMTWRATCLRTKTDDYIIIPNAAIAREAIINYSRPTVVHGYRLDIGVNYGVPPNRVRRTIMDVLESVPEVLKDPAPTVFLIKYNDFSIDYNIKFFSRDFEILEDIKSHIMELIWYNFKRNDIVIPFPIRDINMHQVSADEKEKKLSEELSQKSSLIEGVDIFNPLSKNEKLMLAAELREEIYAAGEKILKQGDEGSTFYLIKKGKVSVSVLRGSRDVQIAELTDTDFFGEMSFLAGEKCNATITAKADTVVYAFTHAVLGDILKSNSRLAEDMAVVLENRTKSAAGQLSRAGAAQTAAPSQISSSVILSSIRRFFSLDQI